MSTTTLKLPDELKQRVAAAAEVAGLSPHAFMLLAIEEQTRLAEQRRGFIQDALEARAEAHESRKAYSAAEVHRYFGERASGSKPARPRPRTWRR